MDMFVLLSPCFESSFCPRRFISFTHLSYHYIFTTFVSICLFPNIAYLLTYTKQQHKYWGTKHIYQNYSPTTTNYSQKFFLFMLVDCSKVLKCFPLVFFFGVLLFVWFSCFISSLNNIILVEFTSLSTNNILLFLAQIAKWKKNQFCRLYKISNNIKLITGDWFVFTKLLDQRNKWPKMSIFWFCFASIFFLCFSVRVDNRNKSCKNLIKERIKYKRTIKQ